MNEKEMIEELRARFGNERYDLWQSPTLRKADEIINGERQDQYGNPEDSFKIIAGYWNVYLHAEFHKHHHDIDEEGYRRDLGIALEADDVAIMLSLMKHARMSGQQWHPDNAIDAIGYLAILADRIKGE